MKSKDYNPRRDGVHYIYSIYHRQKRRRYIGITLDFEERKKQHLADLKSNRHLNKRMQEDFVRTNEKAFEFSILKKVDGFRNALEEEHRLIFLYNTYAHGYNVGGVKSKMNRSLSTTIDVESHDNLMKHLEDKGISKSTWLRSLVYEKLKCEKLLSYYGSDFIEKALPGFDEIKTQKGE